MWHGYMSVENLNPNAAQCATLIAELRKLGPPREGDGAESQPARLNHWRTRLDGQAVIFEALFNENALAVEMFKRRLADKFDASRITISALTQIAHFAGGDTPVVTFSRDGTDYLRVTLFGGTETAWNKSGDECRGYLRANIAQWEEGET